MITDSILNYYDNLNYSISGEISSYAIKEVHLSASLK